MKSLIKLRFVINILLLITAILIILYAFIENCVPFIIFGILSLVISTILLKYSYRYLLIKCINPNCWSKKLTAEEQEIIEDAKNLIRSVDKNIIIADFNVYKVKFIKNGWFYYNEDTKELCIFIPFKKFLRYGKNFCFMAVVHEVLHSQNLKNNLDIFNSRFREGLNQLLTIWLIANYSKKYEIPDSIHFLSLRLKNDVYFYVDTQYSVYRKNVNMVQDVLNKTEIDLKQIFINYIDIQPEFFKCFIPSEHLKKQ